MYLANLKFVALTVPEIIHNTGYPKNLGYPWIRPRSLFPKILMGFCSLWTLRMYRPNLKSVALPVPEIIATAVLGRGCEPPILEKGRPQGVWDGTVRKSVAEFL